MWQLKTNKLKFCFWLIIVQLGGIGNSAVAQIVPDHSLPNNSAVTRDGTRFTIEEGTVRGSNLFHSFSKFNVNTGKIAFFNNGLSIDNIITRVTGGELSSIDGLIQANGTANLFLLNPSGIQFGANARLDIGGSFVGSTADSFLFEDGTIYSATNPTETPLLTVSVPLGLQYGSDPTPVRVEEANLEVKSGQTLTLAGGDLSIVGGELRASDGRLSLGSATAGILTLDENLGIADLSGTTRGNINLSQQSLVEVTGNSEGIDLTTGNLTLTEGSQLQSLTTVPGETGDITLDVTDRIIIDGLNSSIVSSSLGANGGVGGNIIINQTANPQGDLILSDGGLIGTSTESKSNGGDIQVNVNNIRSTASNLISNASGGGDSGAVTITSDSEVVFEDSLISTNITAGNSNAGTITIDAENIFLTDSEISAYNLAQGDAGNILINASDRVFVDSDSLINNQISQLSLGNAGTLQITTGDLALNNSSVQSSNLEIVSEVISLDNNSQLLATTTEQNQENVILITANNLDLTNGSQILANNGSEFDAGNINLKIRDNLTLSGENTGLFANTELDSSGKAGNILIDTESLLISEGAIVGAKAQGSGAGGNIEVTANNLTLDNQASINTETVSTEGGNISLTFNDQLLLQDNSKISANSGNIDITSPEIVLEEDSLITNVGTLKITTGDLALNNSRLQSSNLEIVSEVISLDNNSQLEVKTTAQSQENGIAITANNLDLTNGSQILANNGSDFDGGNINLKIRDNLTLSGENAGLFANGEPGSSGKIGNIVIDTANLLISEGAIVGVKAQGSSAGGNIEVTADDLTLNNQASINTETVSTEGGNITLNLNDQLLLQDNSKISAKPGNIDITSPEIILVEDSLIANVGTLKITTSDLALNNSSVQSSNLEIVSEVISLGNNSQLQAKTTEQGKENGIAITANNLDLTNGSQILANNGSDFDGGNINLKIHDNLTLSGENAGLFANGEPGSSGKIGNIVIDTANLLVSEGAIVGVKAQGSGAGGNIEVIADDLTLDNQASISTETVSNQGGNISLNLNDQLLLRKNSNISTSSGTVDSGGDEGNININAAFIIAVPSENSDITANAFAGNGGKIDITTNGIFGLQFRAEETPLSDILPSKFSFFQLTLLDTVPLNNPDIDREGVKLPDRVTLSSDRVNVGCAAASGNWLTISGRGGLPTDPTTTIRGQSLLSDLRDFTNSENKTDLSPVRKQSREELPTSIVQVNGWIINQDGDIELVAALPQETSLTKGYDCPPNSND